MRARSSVPGRKFGVVVADPPWLFGDRLPGKTRGAARNYATMDLPNIAAYLVNERLGGVLLRDLIADDALLFLWRVSAMQEEALSIVRAWGFVQKSELVWVKTTVPLVDVDAKFKEPVPDLKGTVVRLAFGMGRYVRACHESCLIGRRGRAVVQDRAVRSVMFAPVREHSQKPEQFFDLVERLHPGPYLELFAGGHRRDGWTCLGDDHRAAASSRP